MATLDDLRVGFAEAIGAAIFPNGERQKPLIDVPGTVKITPGWPPAGDLSLAKLAYPPDGAGNFIIAVQDIGEPQDVTRFLPKDYLIEKGVPSLSWALSVPARTATLSGSAVTLPLNLAIVIGKQDWVYSAVQGDTIGSILKALALLIQPTIPVEVIENCLYFPNAGNAIDLQARVGTVSKYVRLTGQYRAKICVAIWCGSDYARNLAIREIKPMLDLLRRVTMPDGTIATIIGTGREATVVDMEGMGVASTRITYTVEYSSAAAIIAPQIVVIRCQFLDSGGNLILQTEA